MARWEITNEWIIRGDSDRVDGIRFTINDSETGDERELVAEAEETPVKRIRQVTHRYLNDVVPPRRVRLHAGRVKAVER